MKKLNLLLLSLGIAAVLLIAFFLITNAITKYTGFFVSEDRKESDFIVCLKEQDITLYINTKDSGKTLKNIQLLDYLDKFKIINCNTDNQNCVAKGVNSFPSWVINNQNINKDIALDELSEYSGCKVVATN